MIQKIKQEVSKVVIGQQKMVDALLIGLLTEGHILLEGVPGIAKTTTINTLAKVLDLDFKRIQFTPDLLPSDLIGVEIYNMKTGEFNIKKGPIFANFILADEINRAPAKVQSALLEVMAERQVTIADETYKMDRPFLVMATQNPVEEEGAYNLPAAELDRFMLKVNVSYPTKEEELIILRQEFQEVNKVATKEDIFKMQQEVKAVHVDTELEKYIVDLVFATRDVSKFNLNPNYVEYGVSPRGSINLYKASKAVAYMNGKDYVSPSDIAYIIKDVFRHRIILGYEAEADEVSSDFIIEKIVQEVDVP